MKSYSLHRSGKSFTMRGDENSELGLLPRFGRDLLSMLEDSEYRMYISVVKIYKESTVDLLQDNHRSHVLCL